MTSPARDTAACSPSSSSRGLALLWSTMVDDARPAVLGFGPLMRSRRWFPRMPKTCTAPSGWKTRRCTRTCLCSCLKWSGCTCTRCSTCRRCFARSACASSGATSSTSPFAGAAQPVASIATKWVSVTHAHRFERRNALAAVAATITASHKDAVTKRQGHGLCSVGNSDEDGTHASGRQGRACVRLGEGISRGRAWQRERKPTTTLDRRRWRF